ncbi:MAG: hypothetical protein HQL13_05645 [Candidatus Omnitrophica bacterium]|nr:hypothetical protein [Candidatus Omnitrophota bacterium]
MSGGCIQGQKALDFVKGLFINQRFPDSGNNTVFLVIRQLILVISTPFFVDLLLANIGKIDKHLFH